MSTGNSIVLITCVHDPMIDASSFIMTCVHDPMIDASSVV